MEKEIEQPIILHMQSNELSITQKSMLSFSFLLAGIAALFIEFEAYAYKLMFEGMGAKLPGLVALNLEWHFVFAAIAFLPPLLVYFIFRHHYRYREKLGSIMLIATTMGLTILLIYWFCSISMGVTNCFVIVS